MEFHQLGLGQLQTNCYIVAHNNRALIFDPGEEADRVIYFLTQHNYTPIAILLTHGHFDHIGAVDQLRDYYQIPVSIHQLEANWLSDPHLNSSSIFPLGDVIIKPADQTIELGETEIEDFKFNVIHTPGHSPGGVSFIFDSEATIISGDCLFQSGIGRTDLVGGNQADLYDSIMKLYQLPDHYRVLSGHGPSTTIGYEKQTNPFIRA